MNHIKTFLKGLVGTGDVQRSNTSSQIKENSEDEIIDSGGNEDHIYQTGTLKTTDKKVKGRDSALFNKDQNSLMLVDDLVNEIVMTVNDTKDNRTATEGDNDFNIINAIHAESKKHVEESSKKEKVTLDMQELLGLNSVDRQMIEEIDFAVKESITTAANELQSEQPLQAELDSQEVAQRKLVEQISEVEWEQSAPKKLIFTPYEPKTADVNDLSTFEIQKTKTPYLNDDEINVLINKETPSADSTTEPPAKKKKLYIPVEMKEFSRSVFTLQEDELIKEYVRRNPHLKNTHKLYQRIGEVLNSHTGNSIRSRFFNTLSKDLEYVYKVDPDTGTILTDSSGNYIKTTQIPGGIKKAYTADEDYLIALAVKCVFYLNLNNDLDVKIDPLNVELLKELEFEYYERVFYNKEEYILSDPTIECQNNDAVLQQGEIPSFAKFRCNKTKGPTTRMFFGQMSYRFPQHTLLSWRDRHDKFVKKYGIDNYIYYYNRCLFLELEPEPIKELTSVKNKAILELERNPQAGSLEDLEMRFKRKNNHSGNYNREHTKKP